MPAKTRQSDSASQTTSADVASTGAPLEREIARSQPRTWEKTLGEEIIDGLRELSADIDAGKFPGIRRTGERQETA